MMSKYDIRMKTKDAIHVTSKADVKSTPNPLLFSTARYALRVKEVSTSYLDLLERNETYPSVVFDRLLLPAKGTENKRRVIEGDIT